MRGWAVVVEIVGLPSLPRDGTGLMRGSRSLVLAKNAEGIFTGTAELPQGKTLYKVRPSLLPPPETGLTRG